MEIKISKKIRKKENQFIYDYFLSEKDQVVKILVYEKTGLFKKSYGNYDFQYSNNCLIQQTSYVEGHGITERILYQYDAENKLIQKEYYSEKNQLRYTVAFHYKDQSKTPYQMEVVRMEKFPFFNTQNQDVIYKNLSIVGKDFEGAFYLLDTIEEAGK